VAEGAVCAAVTLDDAATTFCAPRASFAWRAISLSMSSDEVVDAVPTSGAWSFSVGHCLAG
jgi:hypothetical protein